MLINIEGSIELFKTKKREFMKITCYYQTDIINDVKSIFLQIIQIKIINDNNKNNNALNVH